MFILRIYFVMNDTRIDIITAFGGKAIQIIYYATDEIDVHHISHNYHAPDVFRNDEECF